MIKFPIDKNNIKLKEILGYDSVNTYLESNKHILDQFNEDQYGLSSLYEIINNKLIHGTSKAALKEIFKENYLKPNNGNFVYNHAQSKHNYGVKRGWVCLFDFTSHWQNLCATYDNWSTFFLLFTPNTYLLTFDPQDIEKIENPQLLEQPREFYIPWVEVWSKDKISVDVIKEIIIVPNSDPSKHKICYQKKFI